MRAKTVHFWIGLLIAGGMLAGCGDEGKNMEPFIGDSESFDNLLNQVKEEGVAAEPSSSAQTIKTRFKSWDDLVQDSSQVLIADSLVAGSLVYSTHVEFLSTGDIILPDAYSNAVYVLSEAGKIKRRISKTGRGPGEFNRLSRISVDRGDNIYVYDPGQKKIIQYLAPDYDRFEEFYSKFFISGMQAWFGPGSLFTYSPYSEYLFNKLDLISGEVKASAVLPGDNNFKTWLARIQTGGIVRGANNEVLYGLYPESLTIYKFDVSLNLVEKIRPGSAKEFYRPFPGNLNPYGHDERHEKWWASFNHLARIQYLEPGMIIILYYGKNKVEGGVTKVFMNIYDADDGTVLAEDIRLPARANIAGVNGKDVYAVFRAHLDDKGKEIPFRLMKYRFNNLPE